MPFLNLTLPQALTGITAGLHSTNYAAIQALLNGGLKNDNIASDAAISASKITGIVIPTVGVGTSLPASPADGDEYILVDSLTAPTYAWRFKYVASVSDANKWVFIGGTTATSIVNTAETTGSTSYVALATAGPSIVLPRAGVYQIEIQATFGNNTGGTQMWMSYDIGGTGAVDADAATQMWTVVSRPFNKIASKTPGAVTLTAKYRTSGGTATFSERIMRVVPVRVA